MPLPVIPHCPVVALDISILLRVSRLDVFQANTLLFGPLCQLGADVLRTVIAADCLWSSVAVGMAVTCHPPHRSVRAELPHTAPALGFDAEAGYGIRMLDLPLQNRTPTPR